MIESQIESLNFIGGEWVPRTRARPRDSQPLEPLRSPRDHPRSDKAETERAIEAAADALPDWKGTLPAARGVVLMEAANIESREDELARLMALEAGKPMKEARMEVGRAASIFRYYGSEGWRMPGIARPPQGPA